MLVTYFGDIFHFRLVNCGMQTAYTTFTHFPHWASKDERTSKAIFVTLCFLRSTNKTIPDKTFPDKTVPGRTVPDRIVLNSKICPDKTVPDKVVSRKQTK